MKILRDFKKKEKSKFCLALGGGVARGMAHIGVINVLREHKINFDMVIGTSIGSLVGAAYCAGLDFDQMLKAAAGTSWRKLFDLGINQYGLMKGKNLEKLIRDTVGDLTFQDLRVPLAVVATDLEKGEEVVLQKGKLWPVIKASCSIPGIFGPVRLGKKLLVDGGVLSNIPIAAARELQARRVLAVDVGYYPRKLAVKNLFGVFFQVWVMRSNQLSRYQYDKADCLVKPRMGDIAPLDFQKARECVQAGEKECRNKIDEIKKLAARN